jgi:hypothetical protein
MLQSDFLSKGFSYVVCQPGNDAVSNDAMKAYQSGSGFSFMTETSTAVLHPVACSVHGAVVRPLLADVPHGEGDTRAVLGGSGSWR